MGKRPAEIALGPMFIGTVFNTILYGIMIIQVYLYFDSYKKDRTWLKCFVLFLFLADALNATFDLVYVYDALVINFNNVEYLVAANWIFATNPALTGIIASCVQLCYAWRVKIITRNIWVVILIVVCASISMLASIGTSIAVEIVPTFTEFIRFKVVVIVWLVAAAIADICITVSITHHLQKHLNSVTKSGKQCSRSLSTQNNSEISSRLQELSGTLPNTGFGATDDVLNRIIRLTVQNGAITAIWSIIHLTVYLVDNTGLHLIFGVPLSKLYTNSLMSTLNARGGWKISQRSGVATEDTTAAKSQVQIEDVILFATRTKPEHFGSDEIADVESDKNSNHHPFPDTKSECQCSHKLRKGEDIERGLEVAPVV